MANATLTGVITTIFPGEVYGNFEKRVFWVEEQGVQYPNTWLLECHQNDCNILDNFQPGNYVECAINIRGRHWTKDDREGVANTLKCWKISLVQQGVYGTQNPSPSQPAQPQRQPQRQTTGYTTPSPQQQYRQPAPAQPQRVPQQRQPASQPPPPPGQWGPPPANDDLPF